MAAAIKVSDEAKQLLVMLLAKLTLVFRKKRALSELVDAITRISLLYEDELLGGLKNDLILRRFLR